MYNVIIAIHVIASLFLIAVILLQAGRGGGLSDSFGGSQMQNLFGTKSATVLTRLTAICATLFIITCLSLAIISNYRARSLVENVRLPQAQAPVEANAGNAEEKAPEAPAVAEAIPAETQGGTGEAN